LNQAIRSLDPRKVALGRIISKIGKLIGTGLSEKAAVCLPVRSRDSPADPLLFAREHFPREKECRIVHEYYGRICAILLASKDLAPRDFF